MKESQEPFCKAGAAYYHGTSSKKESIKYAGEVGVMDDRLTSFTASDVSVILKVLWFYISEFICSWHVAGYDRRYWWRGEMKGIGRDGLENYVVWAWVVETYAPAARLGKYDALAQTSASQNGTYIYETRRHPNVRFRGPIPRNRLKLGCYNAWSLKCWQRESVPSNQAAGGWA